MGRAEDIFEKIKRDGAAAIDDFILQRASEELFLDFKRSADEGGGTKLHVDDRKNLSRLISGFGNSAGGVIVWGVDCSYDPQTLADLPRGRQPIKDVRRFVSRLEGAVSGCTLPAHPAVSHHAVAVGKSGDGFVATLIPESPLAPHQNMVDGHYLIRAGSSCERAPHGVLAGMFGRNPAANLFLNFLRPPVRMGRLSTVGKMIDCATVDMTFVLGHRSRALARDLYFTVRWQNPGKNCNLRWNPVPGMGEWTQIPCVGPRYSAATIEGYKLPPEAHSAPGGLTLRLAPPFEAPLEIECWYGCAGSPVRHFVHSVAPDALEVTWHKHVAKNASKDISTDFIKEVLPFEDQPALSS
jgi:hypothetical protein